MGFSCEAALCGEITNSQAFWRQERKGRQRYRQILTLPTRASATAIANLQILRSCRRLVEVWGWRAMATGANHDLTLALLLVLEDGLFGRSLAADQAVCTRGGPRQARAVLHLSLAAVAPLLAIRLQEAVIAPGSNFFQPSAGQISQRIKVATQVAWD